MLFKKLWRTIKIYKAQFISMIIMIAIGIGIFVGFNMEWVSIDKNTTYLFDKTNFADYRIVNENGFSSQEADLVKSLNGIDKVSRYLSVNAEITQYPEKTVALTVTENKDVSSFMVIKGEEYDETSLDGIWISDKFANKNKIKIGNELSFTYKSITVSGKVKGLVKSGEYMINVKDEAQLMPDYAKHGFAYVSPALYQASSPILYYPQLNIISSLSKKEFKEKVDNAFGKTCMILSKDEVGSYSSAQGEVQEGQTMGAILPVLFLLIAVLTMVTTMHRITVKEKTQIGTLKALGFKDKSILRHYSCYALIIGIIGSIIGIGLGYFIGWYIMNPKGSMGTYMDLPRWKLYMPWFVPVIIVLINVFLTFIGFLSVKKMLKGTPADALRPYTPKKMRKLVVEKTKLWNKFSFGTKWNLRDVFRHKARTAMSLLGIIGCMIILVASLGMKDTMNGFIKTYYNDAMNYSSHIFISEEATTEQRESIVKEYNGDWSSSIAIQMGEKTLSLDIYNVTHDKVRFPDKNNNFISLKDNGAYICMRIADNYHLKKDDEFKVSPYGQSVVYTLRVAGIMRSVSENIVITPEYASSIGITDYKIDSVYTDTAKTAIFSSSAIKNVQSKQDIIDSFDTFINLMNLMIVILMVGALILGVVVLYNLGIMSYTERYREMATLKVVGFKDKKIGSLLIGQNMWITLIGALIGLPLGIGVLDFMLKALASEYELKLTLGILTFSVSLILTFGMSLLVSLLVSRKNKKIDMVEALKGAE